MSSENTDDQKYFLHFCKDHLRFTEHEIKEAEFRIEVTLNQGKIVAAKMTHKDYRNKLSVGQLGIVNNMAYYVSEKLTIEDVFKEYVRENKLSRTIPEYVCHFCAYLLFFNFVTSDRFLALVPLRSSLPLENFSSLLKRNTLPLLTFVFSTIRKLTANNAFLCYLTVIQNFVNMFDLMFVEGSSLDNLEIAEFTTSVIVEVGLLMTGRIIESGKMLTQHLTSKCSVIETSEATIPESEPDFPAIDHYRIGAWLNCVNDEEPKGHEEPKGQEKYGQWLL